MKNSLIISISTNFVLETEDESDTDVDNEENETDTETPQPPTRKPLDLSKLEEAIMSINRPGVNFFMFYIWPCINFLHRTTWDLATSGRISQLLHLDRTDTTHLCTTHRPCLIPATRILHTIQDIINRLLLRPQLPPIRPTTAAADTDLRK